MTRAPGEWPVPHTPDPEADELALRQKANRERARFTLTLDAIKADLAEQPSENTIHAAARRWQNAIAAAADEAAQRLRRTG
ncbi:hypothetical protein ACWDHW_06185 [Streptomyces melanosporofaciens]